jgi:hypothetical protein
LKRDALVTEQDPQALVGDVVDHPLGHQEVRQLRQAPGAERKPVLGRPRLRDLLEQDHLDPSPGHHRPGAAPHDPQQPLSLVIIDLANLHTLGHARNLTRPTRRRTDPARRRRLQGER